MIQFVMWFFNLYYFCVWHSVGKELILFVCRTAIALGTAIPLLLFLVWNGVILGTITNLGPDAEKIIDPLQQLRSSNGLVGVSMFLT